MKLIAIECKCGHVQRANLPDSPREGMRYACEVCRSEAEAVWGDEIQTVTWMTKEEEK